MRELVWLQTECCVTLAVVWCDVVSVLTITGPLYPQAAVSHSPMLTLLQCSEYGRTTAS